MLPEEVTKFIGKSTGTSVFEVEKEAIRRFADAVGDTNPLYWDEEYARNSRHGSIVAPPGLICAPWYAGRQTKWGRRDEPVAEGAEARGPDLVKAGYGRVLDGGVEWEFFQAVHAGDTLTASSKIKDIRQRQGRSGKMVFVISETTYTNQNGDVVAETRGTSIRPEGQPGS